MIKSTKHSGVSVLELYPPIKGMNNIVPEDLLDKLQARDFNGSIDNNLVKPKCEFKLHNTNTYSKIFEITQNGEKDVYGYNNNFGAIELLKNSSYKQVPNLSEKSSTIAYDNQLLTLSNNELYLDTELLHKTEGHNITSTDVSVIEGCSAAYVKSNIYARGLAADNNVGLYKIDLDGKHTLLAVENSETIGYNWLFSWKDNLYAIHQNGVYFVLLSGHFLKEFDIQYATIADTISKPVVIGDYLYYQNITSKIIYKYSLFDKAFVNSASYENYTLLGGYLEGDKHCLIGYGTDNKKIVKSYAYITETTNTINLVTEVLTNVDLPNIYLANIAQSNGYYFLYYIKNNATSVINIDLKKEVETIAYFVQSAFTDTQKQTIYIIGNGFIGKKIAHDFSGTLILKNGRIVVVSKNMLTFSGVGDPTNWQTGLDDDSLFVEIGYKEGGNITNVINGYDIIVFKDNGKTYRLSGSYPDWAVNVIFNNDELTSNVIAYGNSLQFGTKTGVKEVSTSQSYGDYLISNIQAPIDLTNCKYIYLSQNRNSILYVLSSGTYEYARNTSSFTRLSDFSPEILAEDDTNLYALKNNNLYVMSELNTYDYSYGRILSGERFLIKSVTLYSNGTGSVNILPHDNSRLTYNFTVYGNSQKQKIRQIYTTNNISPKVEVIGDVEVIKILIEYVKLGGTE